MKKLILLFIIIVMCFSGIQVFASSTELGNENISTEEKTIEENHKVDGSKETQSPEETDNANSWRYSNGKPIESIQKKNSNIEVYSGDVTLKGIDVSKWQGRIDWNKVKAAGIDFAIIRCGYGKNIAKQDDEYFERNASECERLGIPYGVYLYSYATNTSNALSEAEHVLRLIKNHELSYPVYYDMEDKSIINSNHAAIAKTFCNKIESEGYPVGVYANLNWWNNYLTDSCFNNWYRWVAQWGSTCTYKGRYEIWQYTSSGSVNGISGRVDMNYQIGYPKDHNSKTFIRLGGNNRYETSEIIANQFKDSMQITQFDTVLVANGENYPDALSGSYLAKIKNAPILLTNKYTYEGTISYIEQNLKENGTVYILGGTGVIDTAFENQIKNRFNVKRLGGATRYDTNLLILKEAEAKNSDIMICSGLGFADSLSASATGKPIMLVGNELNNEQMKYIQNMMVNNIYIIGGTGAVNSNVEDCLRNYETVRYGGANRFETSSIIANAFWGNTPDSVVIAYGMEFADGFCGGPLANHLGCPLILANDNKLSLEPVSKYAQSLDLQQVYILGGTGRITDRVARYIVR